MRSGSDEGFTLIELMASLTVMAIGIVGVIGVMNSSFKVVGTTSARNKGVAVAVAQIEKLRAMPYEDLDRLIVSGSTHTETQTVGGRTYEVEYAVETADEATTIGSAAAITNAYRRATVWVSWTDQAGYHDLHQSTLIYPGGLGVHGVASGVVRNPSAQRPLRPASVVATPVATTADVTLKTGVDVTWVPPVSTPGVPRPASWVVQYIRHNCGGDANLCASFPVGEVQEVATEIPASMTTLRINDFASGGKYHFRVYSKSADGVLSLDYASALNVTGIVAPSTSCTVGTASVTPSAVKKRGGAESSKLVANPVVEVNVLGGCGSRTFHIEYSPQTGLVRTVPLDPTSTGTRRAVINGDANEWSVGERDVKVFSVLDNVKTLRANLRLTVCDNQKNFCP